MKKKRPCKLFVLLLCTIILASSLYLSSNKILYETGEKSYTSVISTSSYSAIQKVIGDGYDYKDLIIIEKDNDGDVTMIITNSAEVNDLATLIATETYAIIKKKTEEGVDIPLGAFSGIRLISGFGTPVKMKLLSVSSVKCNIVSEFQSAGINQTRHILSVDIVTEVSIITKISTKTVSDSIRVLVYDNLIVGKVPTVLLNSSVVGSST